MRSGDRVDRWSVRDAVLFGAPTLMAVSSVLHPLPPFMSPGMLEFLRPRLSLWLGIHLVQVVLVLLLGLAIWFLTEGLSNPKSHSTCLSAGTKQEIGGPRGPRYLRSSSAALCISRRKTPP
jgi:hypothetical protein